ncbi:hypothetical protein APR50_06160 [Variovorax paradoxus]|jgi:hypothetical protein|uniref:hypothetical protein n=1 Tax=Variovorax TaxID=34072 RepID=UPI0006E5F5C6|nr:hypothetical protein APR52_08820 [Variovorax paradoxus]KPV10648.1 hypothetical protein APR50_06160 [Variovorax paradoxus]KPV13041.1 hypothetical protein APR49_05520 [Variovorax paradoxus]KPV25131.1 hypothetical protein APR51_02350 [Variovorax paradoxus]KPV36269.1 hypothetical protein APR48_01605 [Variovorax paradoxus]
MNRQTPGSARTEHRQSAAQVFRIPLILGAATAIGLVSALLADGVWDALSWLMLAIPLAAAALAWHRRE